jgi:hypothetical protein
MISASFRSVLSALVLFGATALAAPPAATPAPTPEKKPKEGYLRFWNLLPRGKDELKLVKSDGTPEGVALLTAAPLNYYAGYEPLPAGRYSLKVVRASDPMTPLQTFDVSLQRDAFVTFVARLVAEKIQLQMVDDTYDPLAAQNGRLVIHQMFPKANVIVTSSAELRSEVLGYGSAQTLDGFPLKSVTFNLQATLADGKRKSWSTEVDFRNARHASLIIMPDMYDRFRVRLSTDGQLGGN